MGNYLMGGKRRSWGKFVRFLPTATGLRAKTNPLNENDLAEFVKLQKTKADSKNSWSVNVADVDKTTFDLSVKNPHKKDETALRDPKEILDEMKELDKESADILKAIKALV